MIALWIWLGAAAALPLIGAIGVSVATQRMSLWQAPAFLVMTLYVAIQIPLQLIGLFLVPLLCFAQAYERRESEKYSGVSVLAWTPRWAWLWGNEQNGIDGGEGSNLPPGWPRAQSSLWGDILVWSVTRNSVGNARWTRLLGCSVDPARVKLVLMPRSGVTSRSMGPWLARMGWRFQLRFPWGAGRAFRLGWGLEEQSTVTPLGVGFSIEPFAT